MFRRLLPAILALIALPAFAQSTVTLTPSLTSGDGTLTIPTMTWATNPPLTGTPCVASATPATSLWTGAKAGSGTVSNLGPFTADQRLTLACTFPGTSIVTFTWTNPTQNTDGSAYTNPRDVRIKYTFNPTLSSNPNVAASGETHVDVPQTPTAATMRTVTGITQTGQMTASAFVRNTNDVFSLASNSATKTFTGNVVVTQQVDLIVRAVPNVVTGFSAQ